jgi:hypothetical protein
MFTTTTIIYISEGPSEVLKWSAMWLEFYNFVPHFGRFYIADSSLTIVSLA